MPNINLMQIFALNRLVPSIWLKRQCLEGYFHGKVKNSALSIKNGRTTPTQYRRIRKKNTIRKMRYVQIHPCDIFIPIKNAGLFRVRLCYHRNLASFSNILRFFYKISLSIKRIIPIILAATDLLQLIYETGSLETPGCIIQTTWLKNRVICIRTEVVQLFSN